MRIFLGLFIFFLINSAFGCNNTLLDHNFRRLAASETVNLCEAYSGKVLLVVNTASKCGYTPQYEGLEQLHARYEQQGLVVLGFPVFVPDTYSSTSSSFLGFVTNILRQKINGFLIFRDLGATHSSYPRICPSPKTYVPSIPQTNSYEL